MRSLPESFSRLAEGALPDPSENLNRARWSTFWSHTYTDWSQIESPAPQGEMSIHGLNLDWHRFNTAQVTDFCRHEIAPLKAANSRSASDHQFYGIFLRLRLLAAGGGAGFHLLG
ncbi:beta-galactosidase [Escherichia coli]